MKEPVLEKVIKLIDQEKLVKTKAGWATIEKGTLGTRRRAWPKLHKMARLAMRELRYGRKP
jgi:hypothetical protein